MKKLNTLFFGTPDFSVPSLDILHNHPNINLTHVISMPDRKAGRGKQLKSPEVALYAKEHNIPIIQTSNINREEEFLKQLQTHKVDLFIVLAFAQFLSEDLLSVPRLGAYNIHTSLLPKYRGAAPIQYAILNNDSKTGVSIQRMVKEMDAGDIVHRSEVEISEEETGGLLYTRLKYQAALSLNDFINKVIKNQISYQKQNPDHISFAPSFKREDGHLNFKELNAKQTLNKIRALYPWPGTYCFINDKRLKVLRASLSTEDLAPGEVSHNGKLEVGCLDGSIHLEYVQLAGKSACDDKQLLNGIRDKIVLR